MKDLTSGNIHKNFFRFAVPITLSGLLSQSYNIIDTVIIGHWLSDDGLASSGATSTYITLISAILWGFSTGGGIFFGMLFGGKDYERLKNSVFTTAVILLVSSLIISPLSIIFKDEIFGFLKIDPLVKEEAFRYFGTYISGICFIIFSHFGVNIFSAIGMTSYPLKLSVLSAILNVTGNILSVTVLDIGVFGVALSTVLSAMIIDIFYLVKLRQIWKELGVGKQKYLFSKSDARIIVSYALPVSCQQLIMYSATFLVSPFINGIGKSATAAYTVINHIFGIATSLYQNYSKTVTAFSSQSIGAKKYHLLQSGVKICFLQALAILIPLLALCSVFARPLTSLFFERGFKGDALEIAVSFTKYWMLLAVFNMVNNLFHSFWRGIANMRYLVTATFIGAVSRVIFTVIFAPKISINGIWLAWTLSWIIETIFNLTMFFLKKWKVKFDELGVQNG